MVRTTGVRQLLRMDLDARMMAAALVAPYRLQGKSGNKMPIMPLPFARQPAVLRCTLFPLRLQSSRAYYVCISRAKGQ